MANVVLTLTRSGQKATPATDPKSTQLIGEWGKLAFMSDGKLVDTYDTLERRNGNADPKKEFVFLPKGNYLIVPNLSQKVGLYWIHKYSSKLDFNSLWPQFLNDGGTPDDASDDTYAPSASPKVREILLHPATNPFELEGCIAPGRKATAGSLLIGSGERALVAMLTAIGKGPGKLVVINDPAIGK